MLGKIKNILLSVLLFGMASELSGQGVNVINTSYRYQVKESGTIDTLSFSGFRVGFFSENLRQGPVFYVQTEAGREYGCWNSAGEYRFVTEVSSVSSELEYLPDAEYPSFRITITNPGSQIFAPVSAGITLGIDTYMDEYPGWLTKFFPTLLMNEKTHFYGYLQSPQGNVLGIYSQDPVASWSLDYNLSYYDIPQFWFYGHRIESVNLCLLNRLPLPEHNPQNLWKLEPGEKRSWTISFVPIQSLDTFEEDMLRASSLPMIKSARTSYATGETVSFTVHSVSRPLVQIIHEDGAMTPSQVRQMSETTWQVQAILYAPGKYDVTASCGEYVSTCILLAGGSWEEVIRNARKGALEHNQKPSSHVESWYGFHSAFLAARHFPDRETDKVLDQRFDLIYQKVFDEQKAVPTVAVHRIQNTSSTIGMLVDRYEAYGREQDLIQASRLADWLISETQAKDGAYMCGGVRYTSVIYVAKSLMELYLVESALGARNARWNEAAKRHYASIKRAIDQLVASEGDFETEGEMTFEDGMISCSALQIGMFALLQDNPEQRRYYTDVMLRILDTHDCLTQLKVNDGRRRGGTMRFWEAQYDVLMLPNMINSPHGWSAWRAYASYYAYLLTLQERYLIETFNAAGAFANLIDRKSGKLRWAFVVDPYLQVRQIASPVEGVSFDDLTTGNPHPDYHGSVSSIIGEQYVDMISSWQPVNSQDNDVHEVFKFIEEAVLTNAYVLEREDGDIVGYNCKVTRKGDTLHVIPSERQIVNLHTNLHSDYKIKFKPLR
jgi:hypothetical protein